MNNFEFSLPTRICFGRGMLDKTIDYVKAYGNNVLILYGSDRIKENGTFDRLARALKDNGINFYELGGVQANPVLSKCYEGIEICRENNIGLILAIGGGSVIDSAKTIAVGAPYAGNVWDLFTHSASPQATLPVGVILTMPAAGSETNANAVITNEDIRYKRHMKYDILKPAFAVMDPQTTYTLPPYQTAAGCVDIIAHVWERYFVKGEHSFLTDRMSEAVIKTIIKYAPIAIRQPKNYEARSEIMWASSIAHNDILGSVGDFASHGIGVELSALYNVTHGASLAISMIAWAKYVMREDIDRFCEFAESIWGIRKDCCHPENTAIQGIEATECFFRSLGMPTRLSQAGIPSDQFETMAGKALDNGLGYIGFGFKRLYRNDIIEIYRLAN